jgi:hypothetical protein
VLLLGALILVGGLVPGTAGSESTVAVMVLCPEDLPDSVPGCEEVAEALDAEIEEFSMFAVPGPSPVETPPQEVAGPGVPFVVWTTAFEDSITLHVYEASNALEVSKTLDLATMEEVPSAYDLAILYRDIMGTSLYAGLAELEDDDLLDLAITEEIESVVLARAAAGKGKAAIPMDLKLWFPQFVMGWGLLSYPGVSNANEKISDVYNGLQLSLRFPFKERFWAGISVVLTQSKRESFIEGIPEESRHGSGYWFSIQDARFNDDQVVINLSAAWYPLWTPRTRIWIALGPGITRTTTQLMVSGQKVDPDDPTLLWPFVDSETYKAYRMTLNTSSALQIVMAPRVCIEAGLRLSYVFTLEGPKDDELWYDWYVEDPDADVASYRYFDYGAFQLSFWLSMVFG